MKHRMTAALLLTWAATGACATPQEDALAQLRAEFQQAYGRVAGETAATEAGDSSGLRAYVLYPYLQAARLGLALRSAAADVPAALDERVAAFLRAHDGQPVALELRRSWLAGLAQRAQWIRLLEFSRGLDDEPALRCHGFAARIGLQRTDGLAPQVVRSWLTPHSLPECERAFAWLRDTGNLDEALVEQRVRLALDGGNAAFARQIAQPLLPERAAPLLRWAALLENPRREIDALIAAPRTPVETPALLAGWTRLARTDRGAASQRYAALVQARALDARAASPFALALALALAWDRAATAPAWFARVDPADFDDAALEWRARAALWAGDWAQVSSTIAAMSQATQRSARWRYWAARSAARERQDARARELYESILPEDNYYAALSAARLKRAAKPNPQALPVDEALIVRVANLPPFLRARELYASGLTRDASAEWRFGQQSLQPQELTQAVHLAARWGWHDQAIATATSARAFNDYALLYPRPFDPQVAAAARLTRLAPQIIYGVLRQESLYRNDAVSPASAHGLMQLQLDTARRTARKWRRPAPSDLALHDPAINVVLGAAHLQDLLDRFDDQLPFALAAYNAGPNAAQRWLPAGAMDPDVWIENIPYNETRSYVQRVLWHSVVFAWLSDGEPQDVRGWLAAVRP